MGQNSRQRVLKQVGTKLVRPLEGRAWLTAAGIFLLSLIGIGTFHLWQNHGERIVTNPRYQLDPNRLQVTPQPDYIRSDVKELAVTYGRLRGASLLEQQLVLQVRQSFAVQPWVKQVLSVNKKYPSTVEVAVVYRRPIAMVEIPAGTIPPYDYEGLLPVDNEAFLLPVELSESEAADFPRIAGIDSSPSGPPGTPWGDVRVAEASRIIELLEEVWKTLGIYKIEVPPLPSQLDEPVEQDYFFITRQRHRLRWGPAPGKEAAGEQTAADKARGLHEYADKVGSLDEWVESHQQADAAVSAVLHWQRTQR